MKKQNAGPVTGVDPSFDQLNRDWYIDKAVQVLVFLGGISAIVFIIGIFVFISKEGLGFLIGDFNFKEFSFSPNWRPTSENKETFGILALVAGTASVTGLAMLIAIPFSLGAAIFIAEFASGKTREFLKITVELLAAIPSVVWGFIGLAIMNPIIIQTFDVPVGLNKVVLPAAKNGLLGAVLLGVGRGFGETMAVLMATGHSINIPTSVFDSVRALTATIAAELGETAAGSSHYQALFTIGIFLFIITFIINLAADLIVRGVRKG